MIEQVLLFSNFAMLKSFQANGNNLIPNTILGVNYVTNDESLHGLFASGLHQTYWKEYRESTGNKMPESHKEDVIKMAIEIVNHEDSVIDYVFFGHDSINDITAKQLKSFIRDRANGVLIDLINEAYFEVEDQNIKDWFYRGINSIKIHDFFVSGTTEYSRTWIQENFTRLPLIAKRSQKI
jgi:ribonucleotide reductase beta subunit family protein with ferritin-like domain